MSNRQAKATTKREASREKERAESNRAAAAVKSARAAVFSAAQKWYDHWVATEALEPKTRELSDVYNAVRNMRAAEGTVGT